MQKLQQTPVKVRRRAFIVLVVAASFGALPPTAPPMVYAGHQDELIGGRDIIRVNPDFAFQITEEDLGLFRLRKEGLDISVDIPTQLGSAVSQAISANTRRSVSPSSFTGALAIGSENVYFDSAGSLFTNKANVLGRGNFAIGLSYQHARFTKFNGDDIGDSVRFSSTQSARSPTSRLGPTIIRNEVMATTELRIRNVVFTADVITLSLTYGLLDRLDIGALVPFIFLNTTGKADLTVEASGSTIDVSTGEVLIDPDTGEPRSGSRTFKIRDEWDRDYEGFGDTILFAKYQLLSEAGLFSDDGSPDPVDLALQVELKLPTGQENEFLGTGKTDLAFRLLIQRSIIAAVLYARAEVGYNRSGLGNDFSTFEYKAALEWAPTLSLSLTAEIIGQDSREFKSVVDGVLGGKYNFPNGVVVFAGVRFPLTDNGLRFAYAPMIGFEKTFLQAFARNEDLASLPPRNLPEFEPLESSVAVSTAWDEPRIPESIESSL